MVSVDIGETKEVVQAFVEEHGLTFPVLLDEQRRMALQYRVQGIPASFLINREGVIMDQHVGPMDESIIKGYMARFGGDTAEGSK